MNECVDLAKKTIFQYVKTREKIQIPSNISNELLLKKAGVFVSIYKKLNNHEELRGCVGTYSPIRNNIAQEIICNAISACSKDNRFNPITENELDDLKISIDVLSELKKINNINELNPKKYGILIKAKNDSRLGLLLPELKTINTISKQINTTLQKANILPNEKYDIYKFTVKRYK